MSSVFIDEIREKTKDKDLGSHKIEDHPLVHSYSSLVRWNNVFLSLGSVCLGAMAFVFMGLYLQSDLKNSTMYYSTTVNALIDGMFVGIILWGIKSMASYSIWRGILARSGERDVLFPFFTIEGMSDISYLLFLPIFLIFHLVFGTYLASLAIGASICFKFYLMYITYPNFLMYCTKADRFILITASIASMIVTFVIIKLFFIGVW